MGQASPRRGLTLDAGALIALDRGGRNARALLRTALAQERYITVPAGALAQAWRGGPRQARLARSLGVEGIDVDVAHEHRPALIHPSVAGGHQIGSSAPVSAQPGPGTT